MTLCCETSLPHQVRQLVDPHELEADTGQAVGERRRDDVSVQATEGVRAQRLSKCLKLSTQGLKSRAQRPGPATLEWGKKRRGLAEVAPRGNRNPATNP